MPDTVAGADSSTDFTIGQPIDANSGVSIPTMDLELSSSPDGREETNDDGADKEGGKGAKDTGEGKDKKPGDETSPDKLTEFHKHPDWQRMVKERDEAKEKLIRLEATVDALKTTGAKPSEAGKKDDAPTYKDITQMKPDEIREWQEDDPIGYAANLYAQVLHEVRQQIKAEQQHEKTTSSVGSTYEKFGKDNPKFKEMWDSGEIKKFMDSNPGHNALSAYRELTREAEIQAAKDQAAKEAEEKVIKNFQAKKGAHTLDGQPQRGSTPKDNPELKNTKQHGGLNAVLAGRLKMLRANRA